MTQQTITVQNVTMLSVILMSALDQILTTLSIVTFRKMTLSTISFEKCYYAESRSNECL
jgi:hypothetical protein